MYSSHYFTKNRSYETSIYLSIYLSIRLTAHFRALVTMFLLFLFYFPANAQSFQCNIDTVPEFFILNSPPTPGCYNVGNDEMDLEAYKPESTDPIKYIRIKIYVMQYSQFEPFNFSEITEHVDYIGEVMDIANGILKEINLPLYGGVVQQTYPNSLPHIDDTRFQFVFDKNSDIQFIPDPVGWGNDASFSDTYLPTNYGTNDCYFDFFLVGGIGGASGFGPSNYNVYTNWWNEYNQNEQTGLGVNKWQHAMTVLHEIGHSFGLNHSWLGQFTDIICPHCSGDEGGVCGDTCTAACDPTEDSLCLSNIMSYTALARRNFTPLQIARMHTNAFLPNNTRYLQVDLDPSATMTISGTQTWETARIVTGHIIIPDGAQLTITCKVIMPPDGLIIVQKGGRLTIDDGHLTIGSSHCGDYWGGIIVLGNPNATQTYANQGVLEITNDALIEYANTAASVSGGGIIRAFDSEIKDCRYSIYLAPYQYPGVPWFSLNTISGCTFSVTDDYTRPDLYPFLFLNGISGLSIVNCVFNDDRTITLKEEDNFAYLVSRGIQSLNSNFRISGELTTFGSLFLGVDAGVSGSKRTFSVQDATFNHCFLGIVSRSVPNFVIRNNKFNIGNYDLTPIPQEADIPPVGWNGAGISIQSGSGFLLRDNTFTGQNDQSTLGVFVSEIGGAANAIRDNIFTNIITGNYAQGINYQLIPTPEGLQYLCNQNDGPLPEIRFDFYVEPGGGIAPIQGLPTIATGNTFHHHGVPPGSDFRNADDAPQVTYFYFDEQDTILLQTPFNYNNLDLEALLNPGDCLFDEEENLLDSIKKVQYTLKFDTSRLNYLDSLALYQSKIDGGDTEALKNDVNNASPWNFSQVSNDLNTYTPYISGEVLSAVAGQSLFSDTEVFNLAIANPETLRKGGLIADLVAQRNFNTTEQTYLEYAAQNNTTVRRQLELDLHKSYADIQQAGQKLIISLMADTTGIDVHAIRNRLSLQMDLFSDYTLVESYWESALYDSADYVLQQVIQPQLISPAMDTAFVNYDNLKQLHKSVLDAGRDWDSLQVSEISQLETLAEGPWGMAKAQARQVLNMFYGYHYLNLPPIPGGGSALQAATNHETTPAKSDSEKEQPQSFTSSEITAFPNPASGEVRFNFLLGETDKAAILQVIDLNGKIVHRARLFGPKGTVLWHPEVPSGVYYYVLMAEGYPLAPQRLIILN
ncbi:MAG: hypothetical protein DHS20C18_24110 [Saprospiraceae bacterium]|nr:MAG: hypothetical protein DHS20C18_24110 [Saprospiraceae bacterium]